MGFSFKKIFSKRGIQSFLGTGGVLPGVDIAITQDAGNKIYEDVHKGLGNLVTGGYLAQKDATEEAKKARNQAKDQYATSTAEAEAEAARIANLEEERKKRLLLYGTQNPSTLMGSYTGLPGQANVGRSTLG
jgi:phage-related protein